MIPLAYLSGTDRQPEVLLFFGRDAVHAASRMPLTEWVKKAPSRRWNPTAGCWVVTAFGADKNPDAMLAKAGFSVNLTDGPPGLPLDASLHGVLSLCDLLDPLVRASPVKPTTALVRPRFTGWEGTRELLGPGAWWDKQTRRFEVPLTDILVHGIPKPGLEIEPATITAAQALLTREETFGHAVHDDATISADLSLTAASTGLNLTGHSVEAIARLTEVVGEIPDWFGMDPYPYQRLGAKAVAAGRGLLCDPTGLGKTLQIIGAFTLRDVQRGVIVVPPVVVTNWAREIERCGLAQVPPKPPTKAELKRREKAARAAEQAMTKGTGVTPGQPAPLAVSLAGEADLLAPPRGAAPESPSSPILPDSGPRSEASPPERHLVVFRAGRKEPELPERGIVVVPDSLLASRPALAEKIARWSPDAFAYDEAHRARTWDSKRAQATRGVVNRMRQDTLRVAATATPLFSNPADLASPLALTGHLDWVFGGYEAFMNRYCKRNHFKAWVPRVEMLPELRAILTEKVWVRRKKEEVLRDLPSKRRTSLIVDVDLAGFRAAHTEVIEKVCLWLDDFLLNQDRYPEIDEIDAWSRQQIGLMSPLRKAAGVAKVPVALDRIAEWLADEVSLNADGTFTCDRPLVVWAHHQEVIEALRKAAPGHLKESVLPMVRVIEGATSAVERGRLVDEFQAGRIPVLVCSITAAGVGITLTRSSDAWFLEADWSVPNMTQAEDRQHRIGQENHVLVTSLLAEGTLDARIQDILTRKSRVIQAVMGSSEDEVITEQDLDETAAPAQIIAGLVDAAIEKHRQDLANSQRRLQPAG